ncbi:MAG TPA: bifunctional hydroxymethylpyrimidine kinase/phosphomethylpyrimidine kinase [Terriglobales bacterium]|nr:bifunctional hydroxymethylpyrimidine kinase/phosphomethylpyrimidine kinase [Terriglobales bacterium]
MTPGPTQPVVLTIAGFDPSSGAGVTADIKTLAAHRCYGVGCITALTVQSTTGVRRVEPLSPGLVRQTLDELAEDLPPAAIRIGMLATGRIAETVADFLSASPVPHVVLDPIIKSSSGADLLDAAGVEILKTRLLPLVTVITPNLDEAAALTGGPVRDASEMRAAAERLQQLGARNVVITGGHLDPPIDLLRAADGSARQFAGRRIESRSTHGTGCAFAAALAANLALGHKLDGSVQLARDYVARAIEQAVPMGRGNGPLNHFPGRG